MRLFVSILLAVFVVGCAQLDDALSTADEGVESTHATLQKTSRLKLKASLYGLCGTRYDVIIETAAKNPTFARTVSQVCGDLSNLIPQPEAETTKGD